MSVEYLIDSNVIIYLFDEADPEKRRHAETLIDNALRTGSACISFQVVQEVLNVLTLKLNVATEDARRILQQVLTPLWRVNPTPTLHERGLDIRARYGFSFYDSLIVAAALETGVKTLLSEDFQHGQTVDGLTIRNPFLA